MKREPPSSVGWSRRPLGNPVAKDVYGTEGVGYRAA